MINSNIVNSLQGIRLANRYANTFSGRKNLGINIKNKQEKQRLARKNKIKAARAARRR